MRPHAPLLALALVGLPLLGHAQIVTRPMSAQQRVEFERCMKEAADDAEAARACVLAVEDGQPVAAPVAPDAAVTSAPAATAPADATQPTVEAAAIESTAAPAASAETATAVTPDATGALPAGTIPATDATATMPATDTASPQPDAAPTDATATAAEASTDPRTDAERDFDALYGNADQDYADPNLPAPANVPVIYDPWQRYNRGMHRFNNAVDRTVAKPLARGYVKVVPRPLRLGVSNFFNNLGQPVSALNALLQGKPKQAGQSLGRFLINSTLGIGGIFDPASDAKLPNKSEDFGQTLGIWGWKRSRYVELPLFGPRTVRDTFGMVGDAPLSPVRQVEADRVRIGLQGLQLVDVRAQLLSTDSFREGAEDDYTLVRDAWLQRRDYQIFGDRINGDQSDTLPDYLRDDTNPQVPADAMPVMPTDGT